MVNNQREFNYAKPANAAAITGQIRAGAIQGVMEASAKRLGAESEGERAAALELALEALYLAKRIDKVSGEGETVYG